MMKKKIIRSAVFGIIALIAACAAFAVYQVCFVKSLWLHAMVAPLNPQSVAQTTSLTYIGAASQLLCEGFLAGGLVLLLRAGWLWIVCLRKNHGGHLEDETYE